MNETTLPCALERLDEIMASLADRDAAFFLDYDGTLTPIVARPDLAVLSEAMRDTLGRLARYAIVAVVSGRDLHDVRERVDLPGLYYAGSHGFDIAGPSGTHIENQQGVEYLPFLDRAEAMLRRRLSNVEGCLVERKRFSVAVHYRQVADGALPRVDRAVCDTATSFPELRRSEGKMIYELQPDIDWDKGKAVAWLMDVLQLDAHTALPLYLGDDVTDEDAFQTLATRGIGIVVAEQPSRSNARYLLHNPGEVKAFLGALASRLKQRQP